MSVELTTSAVTATEGTDFQSLQTTVEFPAGTSTKSVDLVLINDQVGEPNETFFVELFNAVNANLIVDTAIITIVDDDPLIEDPQFNRNWGNMGVFTEAQECARCHRASSDNDPSIPALMREPKTDSGEDISPPKQWVHSIMAHSFGDPYFRAKLEDEAELFNTVAATLEDKCLTCHSPMGRTHAHHIKTILSNDPSCDLTDGCYRLSKADTEPHAREGVSCTLCHLMQAGRLSNDDALSGGFEILPITDATALTIYGPYRDPHPGGANVMQNFTTYTPEFGEHTTTSDLCASCHTLFTPTYKVSDNKPAGENFLEQAPYLEWLNSEFVPNGSQPRECQDCHQKNAVGDANSTRIATRPNGTVNQMWPERNPYFVHEFVGGNTHILQMLSEYRNLLGIAQTTTDMGFEEKIRQTRDFLESNSARLEFTRSELLDQTLKLDIQITNLTGHKLPTAYPSRRVWLHVKVIDTAGKKVFESGAPDNNGLLSTDHTALQGSCLSHEKPPQFDNFDCFEPHRDTISNESEVAIYESLMSDTDQNITYALLYGSRYLKDNRIPPLGFTYSKAADIEVQTIPIGVDLDDDFNKQRSEEGTGTDTVHYQIDTSGFTGPFSIDARLLYQSIKPTFAASMRSQAARVQRFRAMYQQVPPPVEVLATSKITQ